MNRLANNRAVGRVSNALISYRQAGSQADGIDNWTPDTRSVLLSETSLKVIRTFPTRDITNAILDTQIVGGNNGGITLNIGLIATNERVART